jgi:phenol/toluene 2-monooxygenase (NADH) P3/A3
MDMKVAKKLGLKERYALMTRDLEWETTYEPMNKVFPYTTYEGIKIHDWDKWQDPFRLTMDAYWKYQAEKERKLYAIIDAFNQNNGHLGVTDARYINTLKLFLQSMPPLEQMASRGFTHIGRQMVGAGARVACLMQAIDEIRHFQTQIHSLSNYNKYYNGMHGFVGQQSRLWYLSERKSFFDDAITAGPFEYMVAIGFAFEYVLTNLVFVPYVSGAAYNGDMAAMAFGFSAQSDEARHMTLGLECIKFMLEQDPDNLPIVQRWIDKWTWRGVRVMGGIGMMMDYMLPKRIMSFKEAWEIYFEENGGALFKDLARYGIRVPKCYAQSVEEKEHISHQAWLAFYQKSEAMGAHAWLPTEDEMDWLSAKYPNTFDKYYRPRFDLLRKVADSGERYKNPTIAMICQVCQQTVHYNEPGDPTAICFRESDYEGEKYHFCSDHCKEIFDYEPDKYIQAWIPTHQALQGNCYDANVDETAPGFDPKAAMNDYWHIVDGRDNGDFEGSEDQRNFAAWRNLATKN